MESWNKQYGAFTDYSIWPTMTNAKDGTNDPQILPLRYQDQTPLVKGNVQKKTFLRTQRP